MKPSRQTRLARAHDDRYRLIRLREPYAGTTFSYLGVSYALLGRPARTIHRGSGHTTVLWYAVPQEHERGLVLFAVQVPLGAWRPS